MTTTDRAEADTVSFAADGWFRTGDIGRIDRPKDMFISGGENVYPAEIAAALADMPAHLDRPIARYKLPKGVSRHEALPRTGSGKVQKEVPRALLVEHANA